MDLYGAKEYLDRAKNILSESELHSVKYACLELRFCLEVIAYRQLKQFGDEIPGSIVGQWKPDYIIRKLASFSPESEHDGKLSIGSHNNPDEIPKEWGNIAESRAVQWKTFRKHYQTLGSYLHASMKIEDREKTIKQKTLDKIISDIEYVLSATAIVAIKNVINAKCECGESIFIGQSEFEDNELIRCTSQSCGLFWHKVTLEDGAQVLKPAKLLVFKCSCTEAISVPVEKVWDRFHCRSCRNTYRLNLGYSQVITL
nr:hypothetical protein [uncultured Pseudomonas sp.]